MPAGGSCCKRLKSRINLFLDGVDMATSRPPPTTLPTSSSPLSSSCLQCLAMSVRSLQERKGEPGFEEEDTKERARRTFGTNNFLPFFP